MKTTPTSFLIKAAKAEHTKALAIYLAINFIIIQAVLFPGIAFAGCPGTPDPNQQQQNQTQATVPVNTTTTEPAPTPPTTEPTQNDTSFLNSDSPLSSTQNTSETVQSPGTVSLRNGHSFVYDTDTTGRFIDGDGAERAYVDVHEIVVESSPILIPNGDGRIHLPEGEIWIGDYRDGDVLRAIVGRRANPLVVPELTHEITDITDKEATVNATVSLADGEYFMVFVREVDGDAATYSLERIGQTLTITCGDYGGVECFVSLDPEQMEYPYRFTGKLRGLKAATTYTYEIRVYREPNSWDVIRTTPPVTFRTEESSTEITLGTPTTDMNSSGLSARLSIPVTSTLPYGAMPYGGQATLHSRSLETNTEYSHLVYEPFGYIPPGAWSYIFMPPAASYGDYIVGNMRDSTQYLVTHPDATTRMEYWWTFEWYDYVTIGPAVAHSISSEVVSITFGGHVNDPPPDPQPNPNQEREEPHGIVGRMCGGSTPPPQINIGSNAVAIDASGNAIFKVSASNILSRQIIRLALMTEGGSYRFFNMMADGSGNYLFNWYLDPLLRYRYYFSVVSSDGVLSQTQERTVEPVASPALAPEPSSDAAMVTEVTSTVTPQVVQEQNPSPQSQTDVEEPCGYGCYPDCPIKTPTISGGDNAVTIDPAGNAVFSIGVNNLLNGYKVRLALMEDGDIYRFYNMLADGYGNYLFNQYLNRLLRYRYYFMVVDSSGKSLVQTQEKVIESVAPPEVSIGVPTLGDVTETTGTVKANAQLPIGYKLTLRIIQGPTLGEVTMTPDFSVPQVMGCAVGYVCSSAFIGTLTDLMPSADYQYEIVMTDPSGKVVKISDKGWFGTKGIIDDLEALVRHHPATRLPSDTRYNSNFDFNDNHSVDAIDQLMMRNIATIAKRRPDIFDRIYTKIMAEVSARLGAIEDAERPTGPLYEPELDPNHDGKIDEVDREMIKSALIKVRLVMDIPTSTPKAFSGSIVEHIDGMPSDWEVYAMVQDPTTGEWSKREMTIPVWQNYKNPLDVDGNGIIEQADAQLLIDRLTTIGIGPVDETVPAPPYYDVNGDGFVSPMDSLAVINFLLTGTTPFKGGYRVDLTGLAPETGYQYYVVAYDGQNKELSRTAVSSFTTLPPTVSVGIPSVVNSTDTSASVNVNAQLPAGYALTLAIVSGPTSGKVTMVPDTSIPQAQFCLAGYVCSSAFTGTLESLKPSSDYQIQVVMTDKDGKVVKTSDIQNLKTQSPPPAVDLDNPKIGPVVDTDSALVEVHAWVPSNYTIRLEIVDGPTGGNTEMKFNDGSLYPSWVIYDPHSYEPAICLDGYVCGNAFIANLENLAPGSDYQVKARVYDEHGKLVKESDPLSFRTYDLPSNFINEPVITFDGTKASITVSVDRPLPDHKVYFEVSDPVTGEWRSYEFPAGTTTGNSVTLKLDIDNLIPGRQYYYTMYDHETSLPQCDSRPSPSSPCATGLGVGNGYGYSHWFTVPLPVKPVSIFSFHLGSVTNVNPWDDYMTLYVNAEASGLKPDENLYLVVKGPGGPYVTGPLFGEPFVPYTFDTSYKYHIAFNGTNRLLNNTDYTFTVQKRDSQGKVLEETTSTSFRTPPPPPMNVDMHIDLLMINDCPWGGGCSYIEVSIPNIPPSSYVFLRLVDETDPTNQELPIQLSKNTLTPFGGGNADTTYKSTFNELTPGHTYRYYIQIWDVPDGLSNGLANATLLSMSQPKTLIRPPRMGGAFFTELGSYEAKMYVSTINLLSWETVWIYVKDMKGNIVWYATKGYEDQEYWIIGLTPDTDYTYELVSGLEAWNTFSYPTTITPPVKFHTKPAPVIPIQVELTNVGYSQASFNAAIQNLSESLQVRIVLIDDQFNTLVYSLGGGDGAGNFISTIPNLKPGTTYTYQVQVTYTANEIRPDNSYSARTIVVSKSEQATFTTRSESDPPYIPKPVVEAGMTGTVRITVDMEAVRNGGIVTLHAKNTKTNELYSRTMNAGMSTWTGMLYYYMFSNPNHSATYGWSEELQQWVYTTSDEFVFWITVDVGGQEIAASDTASATLSRV